MDAKIKPDMLFFSEEKKFKRKIKRRDNAPLNKILIRKGLMDFTEKDRVELFMLTHNLTDKYHVKDLYRWHTLLTKSCTNGKDIFAKKMGLNMETDEVTLPEFFEGVSKEHGHEIMADIYKKMKEKEEKEKEKSVKKIQKPFLIEKATILKEFDKIKKKK